MILNALQSTNLQFAISLDSDIAYSVIANPALKDIVMPDEIVNKFDFLKSLVA